VGERERQIRGYVRRWECRVHAAPDCAQTQLDRRPACSHLLVPLRWAAHSCLSPAHLLQLKLKTTRLQSVHTFGHPIDRIGEHACLPLGSQRAKQQMEARTSKARLEDILYDLRVRLIAHLENRGLVYDRESTGRALQRVDGGAQVAIGCEYDGLVTWVQAQGAPASAAEPSNANLALHHRSATPCTFAPLAMTPAQWRTTHLKARQLIRDLLLFADLLEPLENLGLRQFGEPQDRAPTLNGLDNFCMEWGVSLVRYLRSACAMRPTLARTCPQIQLPFARL